LVLYYSRGGSVARLAKQVARGVGEIAGMSARLRTVPPVAAVTQQASPPEPEEGAPYVHARDLAECVGLVIGSPTRFGNMAAPLKHFIDGLGAEWASGTLVNKPAGVFTSTATQHGGQETTLFSIITNLLHFGLVIVGLPYSHGGQMTLDEIVGGAPYGATTIAGGDGSRQPSEIELAGARHQGELVAKTAAKLFG
jgi:NAD(P)H dehydrogenase (quinone)